ncbi:MAG: hypothetical protein ACREN5_17205 [Gemmatimonadales bacterium]
MSAVANHFNDALPVGATSMATRSASKAPVRFLTHLPPGSVAATLGLTAVALAVALGIWGVTKDVEEAGWSALFLFLGGVVFVWYGIRLRTYRGKTPPAE